jgi:hypothetical protein
MVLVPRSRVQEYVAVAVPKKQDEQRVRAGFNAKKNRKHVVNKPGYDRQILRTWAISTSPRDISDQPCFFGEG